MRKNTRCEAGQVSIIAIITVVMLINVQCIENSDINVSVISSSTSGNRLTKLTDAKFIKEKESPLPVIKINEALKYQKMDGFGASFNEAGIICLNSLDENAQESVLRMLFDSEAGAGFTLMKSPIAACDFASSGPWYSYNDTPGDTSMNDFSIKRDLGPNGLITYIKKASKYGKFEIESPMDFAPDWMYFSLKKGDRHIRPEYYDALALYYSKYIQAYAENGITINYLNLFNEADNQHYSNVTYKAMGEMIKNHIVPRFIEDGIATKIQLGETVRRQEAMNKFPPVLNDYNISKHISGLTVHGYDWHNFASLTELHNNYPDKTIWMTEVCYATFCCIPPGGPTTCPVYEFDDGEFWGNMIINDIKNWVSGWIYWNMILDQKGGPWLIEPERHNPDNNHQHPVVIINRDTKKVTYTGLYYYLSHFSKFVKPGDYRIDCSGDIPTLNYVGFQKSDGSIVLNVINNSDEIEIKISWGDRMIIRKLEAHSITTFLWDS